MRTKSFHGERSREKSRKGAKLYLPVDFVVADRFARDAETKVVPTRRYQRLDGPGHRPCHGDPVYRGHNERKTIVWNGPMGVFEIDAFSRGTFAMVSSVASHRMTIVGGGDTDVAVHRAGEYAKMSYISTGAGRSLNSLKGRNCPG
jgi:phosphoglycerate kinase